MIRKTLSFLIALTIISHVTAQESQWQPFGELTAGVTRFKNTAFPSYGASIGMQKDNLAVGLRYRISPSPLHEFEPAQDVSLMFQTSGNIAPHLELYGGLATGFAIQHSQLLYDKPLSDNKIPALNAEINMGIRYYVAENVALTFNIGAGCRLSSNEWQALAKQLPYDPRTFPTFVTATGGIVIGIPPKVKKVNLPAQLIVPGNFPILTAYND